MGNTGQWMIDPLTDRELEVLRHLSDGKSDREVAQALHLSVNTVKWHNRQIYSKLGVGNREQAITRATDLGLLCAPPGTSPGTREHRHNLPAPITSFVGRGRQVADVRGLLTTSRLLTLCGPPGTGKTRLALHVAATVLDQFADGVFFVDLAPISDPRLVATTISQVLDVREQSGTTTVESLKDALCGRQMLLLLDNFEQIVEAAPLVTDLLTAAPDLKIMVTSREVLRVYGEQTYFVPPLELPAPKQLDTPDRLAACEAVDLFLQRARSAQPDFTLTADNALAVAEVCIMLDGLPLAIELAAARIRAQSPQLLAARLENRLATLVDGMRDLSPRHQTLHATIDWSYKLLEEGEKQLLARLAAFQGGRTVEAARAVCGSGLPIDVTKGLESLLSKSLLWHEIDAAGQQRFYMLETIHEYAGHRLAESGEEDAIRRRHAEHFLTLAKQAEPKLCGSPHIVEWLTRLEADFDNIRAALAWALAGANPELGMSLIRALDRFWIDRAHIQEASRWCERALAAGPDAAPGPYARVHITASNLAYWMGDEAEAIPLAEEALALAYQSEEPNLIAWSLVLLARPPVPDYQEGVSLAEESLSLFQMLGDGYGMAFTLNELGELARNQREYDRAEAYYLESTALHREIGNTRGWISTLYNLGIVALAQEATDRARAYFEEALTACVKEGFGVTLPSMLIGLAGVAGANRHPARATHMLGAAEALTEEWGDAIHPSDRGDYDRILATAREQMDDQAFENAWEAGRAMSQDEAVAYALQDE